MAPLLSVCIPTYQRAELLEDCLTRLEALENGRQRFEVVVSDNASTDHTAEVIARHRSRKPYLRAFRQPQNVGGARNLLNAFHHADGEYAVYLADDDSLLIESLLRHLDRMQADEGLVALYADWVAYDDAQGRELHRYFKFPQPQTFGPTDPIGLVNFVLAWQVYPEIAVYRRAALLRSHCFVHNGYPFHLWLYRLSRLGRVAFEKEPFYREHRVLQPRFQRSHWANLDTQHALVGDEMRNTLESMVLWAFQDAGFARPPAEKHLEVKRAIDGFLHNRTLLNIERAIGAKNWILAGELRRRLVLWHGPGEAAEQQRDVTRIAVPCACQAIYQTYASLTEVSGLVFHGFASGAIPDFFRAHYPQVPLLGTSIASRSSCCATRRSIAARSRRGCVPATSSPSTSCSRTIASTAPAST
jgi:hypothetical protein